MSSFEYTSTSFTDNRTTEFGSPYLPTEVRRKLGRAELSQTFGAMMVPPALETVPETHVLDERRTPGSTVVIHLGDTALIGASNFGDSIGDIATGVFGGVIGAQMHYPAERLHQVPAAA